MTSVRSTVAVLLVMAVALFAVGAPNHPAEAKSEKPNIVFILTDDQTTDMIRYTPYIKSRIMDRGLTLDNAIFTNPWCCPSRASILRGQYAHNHDIWDVRMPLGGNPRFVDLGEDRSTMATWVQDSGYATGYVGRYLNSYHSLYVPPGYNEWYGRIKGHPDYVMNANGRRVPYKIYETDMYSRKAQSFIKRRSKLNKPFFLQVGTFAPHSPGFPAERHKNEFQKIRLPRTPATNERDVSDKPAYIRNSPRLSKEKLRKTRLSYRERVRALQAVDEMVRDIFTQLRKSGELDNTYVFFFSDNGYMTGQHRLSAGKRVPYEESIRFPLMVFGPGVPKGESRDELVSGADLAPTFAEIAGAKTPGFVDGSSAVPLLGREAPDQWRDAVLSESADVPADRKPGWKAVRTERYTYVEYSTGERELYDLVKDPYQLENIYEGADPDLLASLKDDLDGLKDCKGAECAQAEGF